MYVRVHVCKCSDCRRSASNLVSDTLLAWLIKSPLAAGGLGRATRTTLSLTQMRQVCSRPPREQNTHPPPEEKGLCKGELHFFIDSCTSCTKLWTFFPASAALSRLLESFMEKKRL